jgi:hypothetical protein
MGNSMEIPQKIKNRTIANVLTHTCNPRHLGSRDWKDRGSIPAWAKLVKPHLNKQARWWCTPVISVAWEAIGRRTVVEAGPGKTYKTLSEK